MLQRSDGALQRGGDSAAALQRCCVVDSGATLRRCSVLPPPLWLVGWLGGPAIGWPFPRLSPLTGANCKTHPPNPKPLMGDVAASLGFRV